jgi:hypothetical protein
MAMQVVLTVNVPGLSAGNGALRPAAQIADRMRNAADLVQSQSQAYANTPYTAVDQGGNTLYSWVVTAT